MKQQFNLQRIGMIWRLEWRQQRWALALLGLISFMGLVIGLTWFLTQKSGWSPTLMLDGEPFSVAARRAVNLQQYIRDWDFYMQNEFYNIKYKVFSIGAWVFGILVTYLCSREFSNRLKTQHLLMLPATRLEWLAAKWLMAGIMAFFAYITLFCLADVLAGGIFNHFIQSGYDFSFEGKLNRAPRSSLLQIKAVDLMTVLALYFFVIAFILTGAIFFRDNRMVKTLILLIAFFYLVATLRSGLLHLFMPNTVITSESSDLNFYFATVNGRPGSAQFQYSIKSSAFFLFFNFFLAAIISPLLFKWVGLARLKEKQIA